MHKDFDVTIENLSKIEGHADLEVKVRGDRVVSTRLRIHESKRFFTQAIRGMPFNAVPQMVSRICGTCSSAHLTCCTEAVESAIGIEPSEQTIMQRKLLMYANNIRDHAMHLYFFCLPDLLGKDSVLDLEGDDKELLHKALHVKGAGADFAKIVGGRVVHPPFLQLGRFTNVPSPEQAKSVVKQLDEIRPLALEFAELFHKSKFEFRRSTHFIASMNDDFSYRGEELMVSNGVHIGKDDYFDHLRRVIIPYSTATGFEFEGGMGYMVGALARMNLNKSSLHPDTKRDCGKYLHEFPSDNVFHNNLAQAVEIIHAIDASKEILETQVFRPEPPVKMEAKEGTGVAAVEAPRGTLYYMMKIGKDGKVRDGTLVIPTQQNQVNIEKDAHKLVQESLGKLDVDRLRDQIEKLIRAYDPCMSCASHFLRLKMKKAK